MNLFQKMSAITQEISTVAKNLNVDTGGGKGYRAVSEADVLAAVKPIENKYGVYSFPESRRVIDSGEIVTTKTWKGEVQESKRLFLRVETVYTFVNCDDPTERISMTVYGDGVDTQDKAPGKAMTYADKYALLKAYKIQTGDDPDKDASEELRGYGSGKVSEAPKQPAEAPKRGGNAPQKPGTGIMYYSDDDILAEVKRTGMEKDFETYLRMNHLQDVSELSPKQAHSLMVVMKEKPTV